MVANQRSDRKLVIIKFWIPVFLCMLVIFILSSIPGSQIPSIFLFQDLVFHIFIYFVLAWFFARALKNTYPDMRFAKVIIYTAIFGVIYGISDEFHQAFVPYRYFSGMDMLFNGIGSLVGGLVNR
ncbi:MAG: VanZ family protein [Candidatus Omnitrophica bacterium]|nr:VanZ family protein [Candidatus Omnitrophota bacterium]MBU1905621.1 VanZ family protein [Candidatus Omnitrophota bacterium]